VIPDNSKSIQQKCVANQCLQQVKSAAEHVRKVGQYIEIRGRATLIIPVNDEGFDDTGKINTEMLSKP
jgi:hypothetical protein